MLRNEKRERRRIQVEEELHHTTQSGDTSRICFSITLKLPSIICPCRPVRPCTGGVLRSGW
eukprot:3170652-Pyramimonas_sp.AAC.1